MDDSKSFDIYTVERLQLTQAESELLMEGCRVFTLKKNEVLYNAGDADTSVYYLRRGKVKYHIMSEDGASRTIAYCKAPGFIGLLNVLPAHNTVNYCTAVTLCEVAACPIEPFMARAREHGLTEKLFYLAVGMSRHIHSYLTALLSEDRAKLVDSLRNEQMLTLQETADFVGCSRVHVSRICKKLAEEKKTAALQKKTGIN